MHEFTHWPNPPPPAGGGAYYFAKQQVNAERKAKYEEWHRKRRLNEELEQREAFARTSSRTLETGASASSTVESRANSGDGDRPEEKDIPPEALSKYASPSPYRSPKGNRFS